MSALDSTWTLAGRLTCEAVARRLEGRDLSTQRASISTVTPQECRTFSTGGLWPQRESRHGSGGFNMQATSATKQHRLPRRLLGLGRAVGQQRLSPAQGWSWYETNGGRRRRGSPADGARHLRVIGQQRARSWLPCLPNVSIVRSAFSVRLECCLVCSSRHDSQRRLPIEQTRLSTRINSRSAQSGR